MQIAANKSDTGLIVISGSVYLVGEARSLLLQNAEPDEAGNGQGGAQP
jgi:folylpolyglutamate synthase/dihydropteroate synthase